MRFWLLRQRWVLTIGVLGAGVGACTWLIGALGLLALWPRLEPWIATRNVIAACAVTLAQRHDWAHLLRVTPAGPQFLVHPATWCAPAPQLHHVVLAEIALAALVLLRVLTLRPLRWLIRTTWFWVQGVGRIVPGTTHGTARWARWIDLRRRWVRPWEPPYVLGRARFCTVGLRALEQNLNVLIVGQPGAGKSSALFIANLLRAAGWRWPGKRRPSHVATDPKREFYEATSRAMARHHQVRLIDFFDPASHRYNPLAHIHSPADAQRFAEILIDNTGGRSSDNPFWDATVILMLVAAIEHLNALARRAGRDAATLTELAAFVGRADFGAMQREMKASVPTARRAAEQFMANVQKKPELEGSIQAGIPLRFQFLNEPTIAQVTGGNDIDFHALGQTAGRPWMVYVVVTRGRERILQPLIVSFFTQMFDTLVQDANHCPSGRLERPVICELDEAGTIGRIADLAGWLNTLRSAGIWCRLAVQTVAQLVEIYGEVATEAITQACQTFVFFGGSEVGRHGAEWMSKQLGQRTAVQEQRSAGRQREELLVGQGGLARAEVGAALMSPDDFLRMRRHWMVVIPRHAWPMKLGARPYTKMRRLRRRVGALPRPPGVTAMPQPAPRRPHPWAPVGVPLQQRPQHSVDWSFDP